MYPVLTYICGVLLYIYVVFVQNRDTEQGPDCLLCDNSNPKAYHVITVFFFKMILSFEICLYSRYVFIYEICFYLWRVEHRPVRLLLYLSRVLNIFTVFNEIRNEGCIVTLNPMIADAIIY